MGVEVREPLRELQECGLPEALEVMGERWSFMILRASFNGLHHFEEFLSELGIARNILSNRLSRLVEHNILDRKPHPEDRRRIIHVICAEEESRGVVIHEVIESSATHEEARHGFSPMDLLLGIGDCTRFDQSQRTVAPHLGVDAEIFVRRELTRDSVRDRTDPELKRRPILDERGDVLGDLALLG